MNPVLFVLGLALPWVITFVINVIQTATNNNEVDEEKETILTNKELRYDYERYQNDPDMIPLTFSQFHSYYSLRPIMWHLGKYFAKRIKDGVSDDEIKQYDDLCSQYGEDDVDAIFKSRRSMFHCIHFATFDDFKKYRKFVAAEQKRIAEEEERERLKKEAERKKELTVAFLESMQKDIDSMRKLSQDEYNQALDTVSRIQQQVETWH